MQKWEYQVFASHLDPAELVIYLNKSGREGWELVTMARVTDYYPPELIEPATTEPGLNAASLAQLDNAQITASQPRSIVLHLHAQVAELGPAHLGRWV
jgi:hypothetical protein